MKIRRAATADADGIARVQDRGWRVGYAHVFPEEAWEHHFSDPVRWRARLEDAPPRMSTFVAADGGGVAGFASVGPSRDEAGIGELYAIYVDPDVWGTGVGRALIARAEAELRAAGFAEATLWVLDDNPRARGFYEAAGWYADGAAKQDEHLGVTVDEVRYRKRLK